jgi:hypothetical protein
MNIYDATLWLSSAMAEARIFSELPPLVSTPIRHYSMRNLSHSIDCARGFPNKRVSGLKRCPSTSTRRYIMSMRGEIISKEYQKLVWVQGKDGKEYACYIDDVKNIKRKEDLTEEEKAKCLDISQVVGDTW